jgi:hypothetical protein
LKRATIVRGTTSPNDMVHVHYMEAQSGAGTGKNSGGIHVGIRDQRSKQGMHIGQGVRLNATFLGTGGRARSRRRTIAFSPKEMADKREKSTKIQRRIRKDRRIYH